MRGEAELIVLDGAMGSSTICLTGADNGVAASPCDKRYSVLRMNTVKMDMPSTSAICLLLKRLSFIDILIHSGVQDDYLLGSM